ncbi:BamA/OMP85 family outer membrane protein [Ferruginibacter albus]|uniref:BamA/OMP85 family outer membrane protein n=1 Tax=Ferruginibacter albus TaxID=2875540 RepID=UPI001CC5F83F|nr:POTRA domain-containing protein [Ferruginibacter albus]UAY51838.1 outer membrane protein assembly factor [Ferruginibacter albus]
MHRIYQSFIFIIIAFVSSKATAQIDSIPPASASVNPALVHIFESRVPKEYVISDIVVTGTKAFDKNLIISISGLQVGDKVQIPGTDVFSKAINKLWNQNLIADVQLYFTNLVGNNLSIEIDITERPRLTSVKFVGVKKGEAEDLTTKSALTKGRVVTENMKLNALEAIHKFYVEKGYGNVSVELKEEMDSLANSETMTFYVNKGGKVKVNSVNISGNHTISSIKLKKQMKGTKVMNRITLYPEKIVNPFGDSTQPSTSFKDYVKNLDFLSPPKTKEILDPYLHLKLFSSAKFSQKKYDEDRDKIVDYYNSQGYRDVSIIDTASNRNKQGNLNLFIKVNEGGKYYFGNISWKGNTKYADSLLSQFLGIRKGDIYNAELLNKRLGKELTAEGGDISSLYMDDGYLFFRIDPVETAVYNDTIDFEIRIQEGPQATIGKVDISGNEKTKEYVIRRELRTVPGEKFSRADIIRTQRELSQLGFFNPEKITPNVVPNADNGTVDIGWQVEEKSSDQLELSAGWGGGIGLTGTLGVTFNNFSINNIFKKSTWDPLPSGDGQRLSARVQSNGKAYSSYSFSFTEPWLGGKRRNSLTVALSSTKYSNAVDPYGNYCSACADTSFIRTMGVSVSLGKQLKWPDDYFSLIYSLEYQRYDLKNYSGIFSGLSNGNSNNINFKVTLARNATLGNPIFPIGGSNFFLSGQFTLPYSLLGWTKTTANQYAWPEFHKWRFNGEYYVPIGRGHGADKNQQLILKFAAKYGFIGKYNSKLQVSPFERFQLGDAGLSNSFALLGYDIIAQRGYPVYSSSDPKINPENVTPSQFFTIFNKYTMELRYPFSTSPTSTIYGLAFFEAANGWYDFKDYNPFKLRRSVGVGMRFFLPMFGLLGFDYGIGIDKIGPNVGFTDAAKFTFMLGQEPE